MSRTLTSSWFRFLPLIACAGWLAATPAIASEPASEAASGKAVERYGEGVTLEETLPIADLLADPDAYVGQRVRVEGRVADVCPQAGCWMELSEEESGRTLRVKVDDGVIVFPADALGRVAAAEGIVEAVEMSRERYVAWLVHLAEERGETVDAASVDPGEGPFRLIRLKGLGAEIGAAGAPEDANDSTDDSGRDG